MGKKAVVLGGGGSRGSYQIGVWKALQELGFSPDIVTGTSVGAINGALMVQQDYQLAEEMWQRLKTRDVMDVTVADRMEGAKDFTGNAGVFVSKMIQNGGADPYPLERLLRSYIREETIRQSPVAFGFVTVEYPKLEARQMTKQQVPPGELVDYLMASAACFPAMKAKLIGGKTYIDGGYSDNVPVKMAVELGAEDLVAVDLEAIGVVRRMEFPQVRLRYLKSRWNLGPFLLFDSGTTARNIQLGYLETQKAFGLREGSLYTFLPGETQALQRRIRQQMDLLLAKTGLYPIPGGGISPAQTRIRRKIRQLLDRPEGNLSQREKVLACCEAAARILGVSPLEAYTAAEMEKRVWARYDALERDAKQPPRILQDQSAHALTHHLMGLERKLVLLYCCRCLDEMMAGRFSPAAARALCSAATEEYLAALYLCGLKRRQERAGQK